MSSSLACVNSRQQYYNEGKYTEIYMKNAGPLNKPRYSVVRSPSTTSLTLYAASPLYVQHRISRTFLPFFRKKITNIN